MKQVLNGETIYTVYSLSGAILYRDNVTAGEITDYIRMGGRTIARLKNGVATYPHSDHLGSAAAATDASGNLLWREDYTPFGEQRQDPAANRDDEGFTGHIHDSATGLTYMQARYYDPVIGRFLSHDPVGFAEGGVGYFNRYAYTFNDPINHTDPNGEAAFLIPVAICAASPACRGAVGAAAGAIVSGGASLINQATDGVSGIDIGRVGADAGKGAVVGGVGAASLNPTLTTGAAAGLGALDGGISAGTDGNSDTTVVGGAVKGAITDGASTLLGGAAGGGAARAWPTSDAVGAVVGATAGPVVERALGEPIGNAVDKGALAAGAAIRNAPSEITDTVNEGMRRITEGCIPNECND